MKLRRLLRLRMPLQLQRRWTATVTAATMIWWLLHAWLLSPVRPAHAPLLCRFNSALLVLNHIRKAPPQASRRWRR